MPSRRPRPAARPAPPRRAPPGTKRGWPPGTLLAPVPAVVVSCCRPDGADANLITLAWAGTVNSEPPVVAVGIRPERHSFALVRDTGAFVVNMLGAGHARAIDLCGVTSGRDGDKWARAGLTPEPAGTVRPPLIAEAALALECRVVGEQALGTHTMFLGEVLAVRVDPSLVTAKGRLALERAGLVAFCHGEYFALGRKLGHFGWSVRKRKTARRT